MKPRIILTGIMLLTIVLVAGSVWAQSGGGYSLAWSSINSGGDVSIGGGFTLRGTIGQASVDNLSGGGYTLAGGFWGQPIIVSVPVSPPAAAPLRNYSTIQQVTLTWNPVIGATAYQVQVAHDSKFANILYTTPELDANLLFATIIWPVNGTFYWHVHAKNSAGVWSPYSAYDTFTINAP